MKILSKVAATLKRAERAESKNWRNIRGIIWEPFPILGVSSNVTANSLIQLVNVGTIDVSTNVEQIFREQQND